VGKVIVDWVHTSRALSATSYLWKVIVGERCESWSLLENLLEDWKILEVERRKPLSTCL
jgi:hypothetical protein